MLDKLHDAGVRHVFAGHYHRNAGGMYKDLELVITSAVGAQLGGDEQGYRVVNVTESGLSHEYRTLQPTMSIPPSVALGILLDMYRGKKGGRPDQPPFQGPMPSVRRLKAA